MSSHATDLVSIRNLLLLLLLSLRQAVCVDGDANAAVTAWIRSGWFKFRSLASFLTAKDISLLLRRNIYDA